mmetsp:Transcript_16959/g.14855  ORF Transcript_16959/g.14855 Transcript_16959/m.14855 type:complete len:86 (+) Transcript_16959:263-520(+)
MLCDLELKEFQKESNLYNKVDKIEINLPLNYFITEKNQMLSVSVDEEKNLDVAGLSNLLRDHFESEDLNFIKQSSIFNPEDKDRG